MKNKKPVYTICLCGLLLSVSGSAVAIEIMTGKWQVETEMRSPMSPKPQFNSSTECITEGSFDPAQIMMQGGQCTITDKQDTADSVSWKFKCGGNDMPVSSGTGKFVIRGKTASGEMQMSMVFNDQTMTITNSWKGRHLGDKCD
ncbi:MAG: DUF3617 domain-containing protein [Gammaproteobacteria bacterium]|nr:DUF3617 domain-containing protein [Gammaproteobacteria bacterium]